MEYQTIITMGARSIKISRDDLLAKLNRLSSIRGAAIELGITTQTLRNRMKAFGIKKVQIYPSKYE